MAWLTRPRGAAVTATAAAATLALGAVVLMPASASPAPTASPLPRATQAPATPAPVTQATPAPSSASPAPTAPAKPKKIKPASKTKKAKNVPERPRDTHTGKRIVYDKALMTVWLMDKNNEVVARYPVVGRFDRPVKGTYRVFSKSKRSSNPNSKVTFNNMVRFTYGPDTKSAIGFHSIPRYYDGKMMHSEDQLGMAIARGGCVRLSEEASRAVYKFLNVGDLVVVLPSP
jgi:lipoprotein-anchoring transpeptidase ErfK/SrfK